MTDKEEAKQMADLEREVAELRAWKVRAQEAMGCAAAQLKEDGRTSHAADLAALLEE